MAEKKITEAAVLSLFREEKITVSRGAELLGIPIQDFIDLLHKNGLTLCDDTPEEIQEGLRNLEEVFKKHSKKAKAL
jgi:predicted HTH domain antitoxin